jgi:hypothetical protein
MAMPLTDRDLEAYLDEALPPVEMVRVEAAVRADPGLLAQLSAINGRRDAGVHSLGEIWRRHRLTCLSREKLGALLLGTLSVEEADYCRFHLETIGCRLCLANHADLKARLAESAQAAQVRRKRYFESSAGYLRCDERPG